MKKRDQKLKLKYGFFQNVEVQVNLQMDIDRYVDTEFNRKNKYVTRLTTSCTL